MPRRNITLSFALQNFYFIDRRGYNFYKNILYMQYVWYD